MDELAMTLRGHDCDERKVRRTEKQTDYRRKYWPTMNRLENDAQIDENTSPRFELPVSFSFFCFRFRFLFFLSSPVLRSRGGRWPFHWRRNWRKEGEIRGGTDLTSHLYLLSNFNPIPQKAALADQKQSRKMLRPSANFLSLWTTGIRSFRSEIWF